MSADSLPTKRIFISYSRKDKLVARQLGRLIEESGHRVWIDAAELVGGQPWWDIITAEIVKSDLIILVTSPASIASPFCRAEWKYALALNRHLIPVVVEDTSYDEIPDELRSRHGLHLGTGDPEDLLHAIACLEKQELPEPLPRQPRLPASATAIGSAFLDRRFRKDLEDVRNLIEGKKWTKASERTRETLLALAGIDALKRGYSGTDDVEHLPCDALEAFSEVWYAADAPTDEDDRTFGEFHSVRAKIDYPTVWVRRKAEIEAPLFDEMRAILGHLEKCDVRPFFYYARPDGELLFIPTHILGRRLEQTCPAGLSLLRFCSFFGCFWTDVSIKQLANAAHLIGDDMNAFMMSNTNFEDRLRTIVADLWSRNLVRNYDGVSFNTHTGIDRWLLEEMTDTDARQWRERVFTVLGNLIECISVGNHWLRHEVERQLEMTKYPAFGPGRVTSISPDTLARLRTWLDQPAGD